MAVNWITDYNLGTCREMQAFSLQLMAEGTGTITYRLISNSGSIPPGLLLNTSGVLSGVPTVQGSIIDYRFGVRATDESGDIADRIFVITTTRERLVDLTDPPVAQTGVYKLPTGLDGKFYSARLPTTTGTGVGLTYELVEGELPDGVTLNTTTGVISGYPRPITSEVIDTYEFDEGSGDGFDSIRFDFGSSNISKIFYFKIRVSDGNSTDDQRYSLFIVHRRDLDGSTDLVNIDNSIITVNDGPSFIPIITTASGQIASIRQNKRFHFQITGLDFENEPFGFRLISGALPTGLTLNSTGWITGTVNVTSLVNVTYTFSVQAYRSTSFGGPYDPGGIHGETKEFSLQVQGSLEQDVTWLTPDELGNIYTGSISELKIQARAGSNQVLTYKLINGGYGALPPGLTLLSDGTISGRPSFNIPHNTVYRFKVSVDDNGVSVYEEHEFSIRVLHRSDMLQDVRPYENLYLRPLYTPEQREIYNNLINNTTIIPNNILYRPLDPWFGRNLERRIVFLPGLNYTSDNSSEWTFLTNDNNHFNKKFSVSELKSARAVDDDLNVLYEVIYVELLENNGSSSNTTSSETVSTSQITVKPNSINNMTKVVSDTIGYTTRGLLPQWMTSTQEDGSVLGFVKCIPLVYLQPGKRVEVLFKLKSTGLVNALSRAVFTVDRYELDRSLSLNFNNTTKTFNNVSVTGVGNISTTIGNSIVTGVQETITLAGTFTSVRSLSNVSSILIGRDSNLVTLVNQGKLKRGSPLYLNGNLLANISLIKSQTSVILDRNVSYLNSNTLTTFRTTEFDRELTVGTTLTVMQNGNPVVIGTVANIISSNRLELTSGSTTTISSSAFNYVDATEYTTPGDGDKYIRFIDKEII